MEEKSKKRKMTLKEKLIIYKASKLLSEYINKSKEEKIKKQEDDV